MNDRFRSLDVTSEKITKLQIASHELETANRHQTQLMEAILKSIPDAIVYIDSDFRIVWGNDTAAKSVGMTPDGLVGQKCYDLKHNCDRCPARLTIETGTSQKGEIQIGDSTYEMAAEHISVNGFKGAICISRDISHRKRNAEMIRKSYLRASAICRASDEGIVIYREGQIFVVNDAFADIVGYTEEELKADAHLDVKDRLMYTIIAPEYRDMVVERLLKKDFSPYRVEYITKTEERIQVHVKPKEISYDENTVCRVAIVTRWEDRADVR